jgi:hypothetical protein
MPPVPMIHTSDGELAQILFGYWANPGVTLDQVAPL